VKEYQGKLREAATLLSVGFDGRELSDALKKMLDWGVGGVILFARNVGTAEEVARLIFDIKSYAGRPLLVGLDQEGGLVQRLKLGFTRIPSMRAVGKTADPTLARLLGQAIGSELRAVGVDVNYAPVLDVDTNANNPVIGERAFSSDPHAVASLGVALGIGLEASGVASCGKHFPGHGDTNEDSHFHLPALDHDRARLEAIELIPFRAWASAQLASIMTAHVLLKAYDSTYPATMSKAVLQGLLREDIGYQGLIVSDDMEMKAIAEHFGHEEAALLALNAGVDQFLICHRHEVAHVYAASIVRGVDVGRVSPERFADALQRMAQFRDRWSKGPTSPRLDVLEARETQALLSLVHVDAIVRGTSEEDPTEVMDGILQAERGSS
jgi:beta-N-acetylhexosaminidase